MSAGDTFSQLEPLSDEQRSQAEAGGNILDAETCAGEPVKRLELIGRMHRLANARSRNCPKISAWLPKRDRLQSSAQGHLAPLPVSTVVRQSASQQTSCQLSVYSATDL
jgi:hypothetical protein